MRKTGITFLAFTVAFLAVNLLSGQQPFPFPGGGMGGPGGGQVDPLNLVRNPQVRKELEVSDEQIQKLPDAVRKALGDVLNDKQMKRLREIELQQLGARAFNDAKVQKDLKFSEEQRDNVKTILLDSQKESFELFKSKDDFKANMEKVLALQKETNEKLTNVLSSDQKRAWKQMLGDEFKMEKKGFAFPGKKGPPKKDNKKDDLQ